MSSSHQAKTTLVGYSEKFSALEPTSDKIVIFLFDQLSSEFKILMKHAILFSKDQEHYKKGFLYFYPTDIAGYFIINTGIRINFEDIQLETSPFSNPFRYLNNLYIMDLLYFTNFLVYTDISKIILHDPLNEYVLILKFKDVNELMTFINEIKQKITLKSLGNGTHYYITSFHKPFLIFPETFQEKIPENINYDYIKTHLEMLQQSFGSISPTRQIKTDLENFEKSILIQYKLDLNIRLECFLKLLNLPDPIHFDAYLQDYFIPKQQWSSRTSSQLKRSPKYLKIINEVKSNLEASNDKILNQIIFNVIMSLIQLKESYLSEIAHVYKIIKVILHMLNLSFSKYQENDRTITINEKYDVNIEMVEAILFWILFKISHRFEIINLNRNIKKAFFEIVPEFITHKIPFIHHYLFKYNDLSCLDSDAFSLFINFFDIEHCLDLWSVGLSFEDSNNYLISLVIAVLIFDLDLYDENCSIVSFNEAIKTGTEKLGQDFIINAAAFICSNRDQLLVINE